MVRPTVGALTDLVYSRLPEVYRDQDEIQASSGGYPLLRYLDLLLGQLDDLAAFAVRNTYIPPDDFDLVDTDQMFGVTAPWKRFGTGTFGEGTLGDGDTADLVDPYAADAAWLTWLAQLVDVDLVGLDLAEQRARIARPEEEWRHGTKTAIVRVIREQLNDPTAYVDVIPHWLGDPFVLALVTDQTEYQSTWDVIHASGTWQGLYDDYGDPLLWSALGTDSSVVMAAANREKPAGFALVNVDLEDYNP